MDIIAGTILFILTTAGQPHHIDYDTMAQCKAAEAVIRKNNTKQCEFSRAGCIVQADCIALPSPFEEESSGPGKDGNPTRG